MSDVKIDFSGFLAPSRGVLVVFCDESLKLGPATRKILGEAVDLVERAAAADRFKGKLGGALDIVAPAGVRAARLVVVGVGKVGDLKAKDYLRLGGIAAGKIPAAAGSAAILAELPTGPIKPDQAADVALGCAPASLQIRTLQDQEEGR